MKSLFTTVLVLLAGFVLGQGFNLETDVKIPSRALPDAYVKPTVTITHTNPIELSWSTDIPVDSVAHADNDSTGFADLVTYLETYVTDSLVVQTLRIDTTTTTIDMIIELNSVTRYNPSLPAGTKHQYTRGSEQYLCQYGLVWE